MGGGAQSSRPQKRKNRKQRKKAQQKHASRPRSALDNPTAGSPPELADMGDDGRHLGSRGNGLPPSTDPRSWTTSGSVNRQSGTGNTSTRPDGNGTEGHRYPLRSRQPPRVAQQTVNANDREGHRYPLGSGQPPQVAQHPVYGGWPSSAGYALQPPLNNYAESWNYALPFAVPGGMWYAGVAAYQQSLQQQQYAWWHQQLSGMLPTPATSAAPQQTQPQYAYNPSFTSAMRSGAFNTDFNTDSSIQRPSFFQSAQPPIPSIEDDPLPRQHAALTASSSQPLPVARRSESSSAVRAPQPTAQYLAQAARAPQRAETPQHLLLVVDMNGTLVFRRGRNRTTVLRPGVKTFLDRIFASSTVMVWSSARPHSVESMCREAFSADQRSKLVAKWTRDKLGLTAAQYGEKVQVYKKLDSVWDDIRIQRCHPNHINGARWDQTNTVLLDDNVVKASSQPYNIVEVPEFAGQPEKPGVVPLEQVAAYLDELRWQMDVSAYIRESAFSLRDRRPVASVMDEPS